MAEIFSGVAVGALVSWILFLYINGAWMEKHAKKIEQQKDEIATCKAISKSGWRITKS